MPLAKTRKELKSHPSTSRSSDFHSLAYASRIATDPIPKVNVYKNE